MTCYNERGESLFTRRVINERDRVEIERDAAREALERANERLRSVDPQSKPEEEAV
jgi:hypothetical protein